MATYLLGQRLAEADDAGLRHRIGHEPRLAHAPSVRDDVDDAAPPLLRHPADDGARAAEHAIRDQPHRAVPLRPLAGAEEATRGWYSFLGGDSRNARIVHQDVDLAELIGHPL